MDAATGCENADIALKITQENRLSGDHVMTRPPESTVADQRSFLRADDRIDQTEDQNRWNSDSYLLMKD